MGPFELDRGGWIGGFIKQEVVPAETGVTLATLRVQDPERRPAPRRAVAVPGDQYLRTLADDVAPEADPRAPGKLQAQARRFGHGTRQTAVRSGRLQHDEQRLRSPGECGEPTEPIGDDGRTIRGRKTPAGQVQDEQIHRAPGQQRATDGQALTKRLRSDDHEPLQMDAPGDRLDRIETAREIKPGHNGARGLGLRGKSQDEGGPAAGAVTADGDARRARQPAGSQDRVERREPGLDDPIAWTRFRRWFGRRQGRHGRQGQGAIRGTFRDPRSSRSPTSLEARHGCRHVRGESRHPSKIEHLFYRIKRLSPGGADDYSSGVTTRRRSGR